MTSWEYPPNFSFSGKYAFASWNTNPGMQYGVLGIQLGPKDVIYCDLEVLPDGTADRTKPGFCKTEMVTGEVMFDHSTYVNGQEVVTQEKAIVITNGKMFCTNASRP